MNGTAGASLAARNDIDDHDDMSAPPPTSAGVSFITLGVTDLPRSRAFYEALGFEASARSDEHVTFFDLSGLVLALFPRVALAKDAASEAGDPNGLVFSLSRNVGEECDVQAVLATAERAGGRILRTPSKPPWGGLRGYFADPDGFAWEIAWNPQVEVLEQARVRWRSNSIRSDATREG